MRLDIRREFADGLISIDAILDMLRRIELWTGTRPTELWVTEAQQRVFYTLLSNQLRRDVGPADSVTQRKFFGLRVVVPDVEWNWPEKAAA